MCSISQLTAWSSGLSGRCHTQVPALGSDPLRRVPRAWGVVGSGTGLICVRGFSGVSALGSDVVVRPDGRAAEPRRTAPVLFIPHRSWGSCSWEDQGTSRRDEVQYPVIRTINIRDVHVPDDNSRGGGFGVHVRTSAAWHRGRVHEEPFANDGSQSLGPAEP